MILELMTKSFILVTSIFDSVVILNDLFIRKKKGNSTLAQLLFFLLELCIVPQEEGVSKDLFCSRFDDESVMR